MIAATIDDYTFEWKSNRCNASEIVRKKLFSFLLSILIAIKNLESKWNDRRYYETILTKHFNSFAHGNIIVITMPGLFAVYSIDLKKFLKWHENALLFHFMSQRSRTSTPIERYFHEFYCLVIELCSENLSFG